MAKRKSATSPTTPKISFEHTDDFRSRYANNARFESTVWDLKVVLGETDLSTGTEVVRQHTAITMPWSLVKVAIYYLQVNLAIHEVYNGKVSVPPTQMPPSPPPIPPEQAKDPASAEVKDLVTKIRADFIASLSKG
jgi:hypothetical protein